MQTKNLKIVFLHYTQSLKREERLILEVVSSENLILHRAMNGNGIKG